MKHVLHRTTDSKSLPNYTLAVHKDQLVFGLISRRLLTQFGIIGCGLASLGCYWGLTKLGLLRENIPEFIFGYLVLFILYLLALSLLNLSPHHCGIQLVIILFFGLTYRFLLVVVPPALSDDIYRYAWEGYLQTEGINPYQYSPQSEELVAYRNDFWVSINNKEVSAIYPPLAQMVHAVIFLGFRSVVGFKLVFLIIECGLIWAVLALLKLRREKLSQILVYAWNPLVIIETAGSGHHDVLVVGLLLWAVFFLQTRRPLATVIFFGGAVLSKLYPLIMMPTFLKRLSARYWGYLIIFFGVIFLPYLGAGERIFDGLRLYRDKWRFNGLLFSWLVGEVSSQVVVEGLLLGCLLVLLGVGLFGGYCFLRQLFWLTGAIILFSPSLHPWYLVWIVPYLCFFPNPAWLFLSGASVFSYEVLIDWWTLNIWHSDPLFMKLQYYPFLGVLIVGWIQAYSRRGKRSRNDFKSLKF